MTKLLLGTAAVAVAATFVAGTANAQVKLDVGGHTKLYTSWLDQDEDAAAAGEARNFDILRETELHFTGETTLDNGLTVGAHVELDIDGEDSSFTDTDAGTTDAEEAYAYFSGAWGRVNIGREDGAAYLLQVAAPSADSNYDGIRQFVNPVNYDIAGGGLGVLAAAVGDLGFDYAHDVSGYSDKLTYMTPVFNGFQAGVSYTPEMGDGSNAFGVSLDDEDDDYGTVFDVAARYEGQFDQVGVALGAGFSHAELEEEVTAGLDDREAWNVGIDFDWMAFGLGAAYLEDDNGVEDGGDNTTWVVGLDYTTGPFKIGASYYTQDQELDALGAPGELETDRYTGGVVYTYGPGMTFRGSVSYIEHELPAGAGGDEFDATTVLLGTQINF